MNNSYLKSVLDRFETYKTLGEKTFLQLNEAQIGYQFNSQTNSVAIIVKHLVGNMLSRWTNFQDEDGEKSWRHRDQEFVEPYRTKKEMLDAWEEGWKCLYNAIRPLHDDDLERIVLIRNKSHTITEAINRQLAHYAYHIGQIVFLGIMLKGDSWKSLSIPKGESKAYNLEKFTDEKSDGHFSEDL